MKKFKPALVGLAVVFFAANPLTRNTLASSGKGSAVSSAAFQQNSATYHSGDFFAGQVVVKFKEQLHVLGKSTSSYSLNKRFNRHGVHTVTEVFPYLRLSRLHRAEALSRVYYVTYGSGEDPGRVAADLAKDPNVHYAEPIPVLRRADTPNDPSFVDQRYFLPIEAEAAWDIVKGEAGTVVIAIVDGGTDWQHADLRDNAWVNEDEIPANGIDDDDNGFVDDVNGWNFATDSPDPTGRPAQPINHQHGTHVAGIAAAVTDNGLGVAGASWNAQLMAVNVSPQDAGNDTTLGSRTFDGIVYAAANGADIISCSWGGTFRSDFNQEVINFAQANGALVVAAAGNQGTNNDDEPHYPANYHHVLSVGSTNIAESKSFFSSYGVTVDLFAPGEFVLNTVTEDNYGRISGTSMSTPLVAGVAGLVKTLHPDWTPEQVREQVRVTADDIDGSNPSFTGLLGKGRVNALRAVTVTNLPSVRVLGASYTDAGGDGRLSPNEQGELLVQVTNFLADLSNLTLTLTSKSPSLTLTDPNANVAALNSNDTLNVSFPIELAQEVPDGTIIRLIADISASGYEDRDLVEVAINPALFIDHDTGTLQTSITTQGNIGFIDFDQNSGGTGFVFNGSNLLFEGGLMIGTGASTVSDCIRGGDGSAQDDDFKPVSVLTIVSGEVSDQLGTIVLEDDFAANPLGVRVVQESFTYDSEPFNDFVIFKYTLRNLTESNISNLYVGQFFDWDINAQIEGAPDFARFDRTLSLGFIQDRQNNPTKLAATKVLTVPGVTSYRSIHNPNEIYGGSAGNGFTANEKWSFLSGGLQTQRLDQVDVSTLTATGPFTVEPDQTVEVAFAVIAAGSESELSINAAAAQFLWDNDLIPTVDEAAPDVSISVLQNPAASKYADIVVVANRVLQAVPTVSVTVAGETSTVTMIGIPGAGSTYRGALEFTQSGEHVIEARAIGGLNGIDSTITRSVAVTLARPGVRTSISALNKGAVLHIPPRTLSEQTFFVADYHEVDGQLIYEFGPRQTFPDLLDLEIRFDSQKFDDPSQLFVYYRQGAEWVRLPTQVLPQASLVTTSVSQLGEFKVGVDPDFDGSNLVPTEFSLSQNFPNPFNPSTIIEYSLPRAEEVELTIFNALGQIVTTLVSGREVAGSHRVEWDGRNVHGEAVASGVFFYRIKMGQYVRTQKMILLR